MMNQAKMIAEYNDLYRPKFNQELFVRHDDDIINAIKNIVLSVERDSTFVIKVESFEVIEHYDDIVHILWEYEDAIINKKSKKSDDGSRKKTPSKKQKKDNQWEFINLKDSAIKLIKIEYYIGINEKKNGWVESHITTYIAIPRVIDKFYYRINGNMYSAMYQIVDASTYNNTNSNGKKPTVTFKVAFAAIRTYRYVTNFKDINGNMISCVYFMGNMFKKTIPMMKYIFAKFGFYEALNFLGVPTTEIFILNNGPQLDQFKDNDEYITIPCKNLYIVINKFIFNNSLVAQSAVYTIYYMIYGFKNLTCNQVYDRRMWIRSLGGEFASKDIDTVFDKGLAILDSLDMVYDIDTKNDLRLNMEDKETIFHVLRWIMYEFNALRNKDNLDISIKKVRYAEYIAALYADKLARGIFRLSDKGDKALLDDVRKAVQTPPMYLLNAIARCDLVTYKGCANDLDSLFALKYTYKGVSGIGEKSNAVPAAYRQIHPSHLGRVDLDSSSPSDPGVSGTICPLSSLHNSYFKEFEEPSTWRESRARMIDQYRSMSSKKTMCSIIDMVSDNKVIVNNNAYAAKMLSDCIDTYEKVTSVCSYVEATCEPIHGFDLLGDGHLFYSLED